MGNDDQNPIELLKSLAADEGVIIPDDVAAFIVRRVWPCEPWELRGQFIRIVAYVSLLNLTLSQNVVERLLGDLGENGVA